MSIEKDIVSRAIKGDGEAFAQLYEGHFDKVYRYIYIRLGNQAEAEDLTQEVFVKALEAIGSYKWRDSPFASWLFRIAHNQLIDYMRKEGKAGKTAFSDGTASSVDEPNPALIAERSAEVERLVEHVGKLPPAQREVILLRFGAELSIAEAAKILGKSPGAVKALQYNAIATLRKIMASAR